jgi:ribonuclease HI
MGAAAVVPASNTNASAYLGREATVTVYTAELLGILIGPNLAFKSRQKKAMVYTDNQAALKTLKIPRRRSGQDTVKENHKTTCDNLRPWTLRGIPLDPGPPGNGRK